jgi:hypothetical protein
MLSANSKSKLKKHDERERKTFHANAFGNCILLHVKHFST